MYITTNSETLFKLEYRTVYSCSIECLSDQYPQKVV
jgi:hypothetical protein